MAEPRKTKSVKKYGRTTISRTTRTRPSGSEVRKRKTVTLNKAGKVIDKDRTRKVYTPAGKRKKYRVRGVEKTATSKTITRVSNIGKTVKRKDIVIDKTGWKKRTTTKTKERKR